MVRINYNNSNDDSGSVNHCIMWKTQDSPIVVANRKKYVYVRCKIKGK